MGAFSQDIFALAQANSCFRREILTNEHTQVVLMSVGAGDDIGVEVHSVDQILVFVSGTARRCWKPSDPLSKPTCWSP
jgi:mannose-6-phosphate isomerase-like protein (cupin superfamily)